MGKGKKPSLRRAKFAAAALLVASASACSVSVRAQDAGLWDQVVRKYARADGFAYADLKSDKTLRAKHRRFVKQLETMPEAAPLSMWLNAYNALVVKAVLEQYPIESVKDVAGFFDKKKHRVAGADRTLDDIENKVIRPRFKDATVHMALNCAARGCPKLHARAFREGSLRQTLDQLAREGVANRTHVRVENGKLLVSELFFWFASDFERDAGSVQEWLHRYDTSGRLSGIASDAPLGRIPYDWALNRLPD